MTPFSPRIHKALDLAGEAHDGQYRKDPDRKIPTLSHLAGVAYILAQHDWDEDTIVAGILHDIDEDVVQKGKPEYENMARKQFGDHVYDLIKYVTQQKKDENGQKIPWKTRGTRYAEKLKTAPYAARAISCADKIHNIECMLLAIERGQDIMAQLNAPADQQIQKFRELHDALATGWSHPILDDFGAMIDKLKKAVEVMKNPDEIRKELATLRSDVKKLMNLRAIAPRQHFAIYDGMSEEAVEETRRKAKEFDEEAKKMLRDMTTKIAELEKELAEVEAQR